MPHRGSLPLNWRKQKERYRLIGSECTACKQKFFPPRIICPECRRKGNMKDFAFSGDGEIYSFTEVEVAPAGFENQVPYTLALIKLKEGTIVTGQVTDIQGDEIKIGTKVRSTFRRISEDGKAGAIQYGFKFIKDE